MINRIKAFLKIISQKEISKIFFVFVFVFSCFGAVYFSIGRLISLDDPMFHIRFAEIIREQGFSAFKDFHWIYFSKISLDQTYLIYYNFLFYLALIPFTFIKSLIIGIKLYGVVFLSLSFTILYYFLLKLNIKKPFFWVIIFLALTNFNSIDRFLLARPFTLTPALLILELYLLHKKNYKGVFLISLLYFYWHAATFFFPLIVAAVFVIFENFYGKKINIKLFFSSFAGVAISFAIAVFYFGGFFEYMKDITLKVFYEAATGNAIHIAYGAEVFPVNFFDYMRSSLPITILFISAVVFEIYQYIQTKRGDNGLISLASETQPLKGALFFLSLMFFAGIFLSQRNVDYYIFFSSAYIAMSFSEIIKYIDINNKIIKRSIIVALIVVVGYSFIGNLLFTLNVVAETKSEESMKNASAWIKNNVGKNEVIFNPTWNWFVQLFYYNPDNYYITGLEPRFLYDYGPELYWSWWNISTEGYTCLKEKCEEKVKEYSLLSGEEKKKWQERESDKIADYIKNTFRSQYIITSNDFTKFNTVMSISSRFEKVFTDNVYGVYVYKIK